MLADLDLTIRELVLRDPAGIGSVFALHDDHVSFATPDDTFRASVQRPTINMFLYDIRENPTFRGDGPPRDVITESGAVRTPVRAYVDCSYLISFWTTEQDTPQPLDEHRALGLIATSLLRYRTIPLWARQGAFHGGEQALVRGHLAQTSSLQAVSEFWQALGGTPRTLLHYSLTAAVPDSPPVELASARPPDIDKRVFSIAANEAAISSWPEPPATPVSTTIQE